MPAEGFEDFFLLKIPGNNLRALVAHRRYALIAIQATKVKFAARGGDALWRSQIHQNRSKGDFVGL